jgi:thermopsin
LRSAKASAFALGLLLVVQVCALSAAAPAHPLHSPPRRPGGARGAIDIYNGYSAEPVPTGIADYGILNSSGTLTAYTEQATAVTGTAVINSMQSTISNPPQGSSPYGAGLQLNVVMQVNTTSASYDYWLQNTVTFYTNNDTFYYVSNVWNYSSTTASMDSNYTSGLGSVSQSGNQSFYGYSTNEAGYTLPLSLVLPINISYSGDAVHASFSYQQAMGGAPLSGTPSGYDLVTITEPSAVQSAVILITGNAYAPSNNYFDSELDFGGDANGANATYTAMNAVLNMSYLLTNGKPALPRSLYEFGSDTAEAATDLQTSYTNGQFVVTLGTVDFGASFVPVAGASNTTSTSTTAPSPTTTVTAHSTSSTAGPPATATSSVTTAATSSAAAASGTGSGGVPEFPFNALAASLLAAALAGSYLLARRRLASGPRPPSEPRLN